MLIHFNQVLCRFNFYATCHHNRLEINEWLKLARLENVLQYTESFFHEYEKLFKLYWLCATTFSLPIESQLEPFASCIVLMPLAPVILRQNSYSIEVLVKSPAYNCFGLSS